MTQMSLGLPLMGAAAGTLLSLALPSKRGAYRLRNGVGRAFGAPRVAVPQEIGARH